MLACHNYWHWALYFIEKVSKPNIRCLRVSVYVCKCVCRSVCVNLCISIGVCFLCKCVFVCVCVCLCERMCLCAPFHQDFLVCLLTADNHNHLISQLVQKVHFRNYLSLE